MSNDLTEKAMLVKLTITKWSARKHDKAVSKKVAAGIWHRRGSRPL